MADNGKVAQLGQKALDFARGKQAQFEKDTKFAPEEREFLLNEWKRAADKMKKEVDLLAQSRSQLAEFSLRVQTRADYIGELQTLKDAEQVLAVIHQLAERDPANIRQGAKLAANGDSGPVRRLTVLPFRGGLGAFDCACRLLRKREIRLRPRAPLLRGPQWRIHVQAQQYGVARPQRRGLRVPKS